MGFGSLIYSRMPSSADDRARGIRYASTPSSLIRASIVITPYSGETRYCGGVFGGDNRYLRKYVRAHKQSLWRLSAAYLSQGTRHYYPILLLNCY